MCLLLRAMKFGTSHSSSVLLTSTRSQLNSKPFLYQGPLPTLRQSFQSLRVRTKHTSFQTKPTAVTSVNLRACQKLLLSFSFMPFGLFKQKAPEAHPHCIADLSPEYLAAIPKDVFKRDKVKSKKRKGNVVKLFFYAIWDTAFTFIRFLRITFTFGPIFAMYPLTWWSDSMRQRWLRMLLYAMEKTGPTFIKLGQWASSRRDLFMDDLCDLFIKLHSHTKRHSWYMTRRKLRKAFGKRWNELFVKIERKPIGSGCIAQVHRAYMRADLIPDDSIVEEVLSLSDDSEEPEVDFAEGLEIVGFTHMSDSLEDLMESGTADISPPSTASESEESSPQAVLEELENDPNYASQQIESPPPSAEEIDVIPVAVKVLHPGIYRHVERDLRILRRIAGVLETCVPSLKWISVIDCMEEFSSLMTRQIDLRFESECLEQFVENFEDNPNIRFPRPIWPYCKRDVLVETYEEGESIVKYLSDDDSSETPMGLKEKLAEYGVDALLQMLFVDNFVHGDLHPGNILIQNAELYVPQEENKLMVVDLCDTVIVTVRPVENPVRLVLLDVGITSSLTPHDLGNLKEVFTAVILGEGDQVAELMLKHARYNDCRDITGFKSDLGNVVRHFREETIRLGKIQVGALLSKVFSVCCSHRVKMESNFASIILAVFVLEGIGRSLDPELDILERAKPILLGSVDDD